MTRPEDLSIKDLKAALKHHGVSTDGLLEKSELVNALQQAEVTNHASSSSQGSENSTSDLKDLIRHLAGRTAGCFEKVDLINRAKLLLRDRNASRCPVCFDDLLDDARAVIHLPCCPIECSVYHRSCVASWVISSAEDGKIPVMCPSCKKPIDDYFIRSKCLSDPSQMRRYDSIIKGLEDLRARRDGSLVDLTSLGMRRCPRCGVWIEKGPSFEGFGLQLMGCDKMTCRCGYQFCYRCGAEKAECACTGQEHTFFSPEDVHGNYPNSGLPQFPL